MGKLDLDMKKFHQLYIKGSTTFEIARYFNCKPATIRTRITRERQRNPEMWPTRTGAFRSSQIQIDVFYCDDCQRVFALDDAPEDVVCPACVSEKSPKSLGKTWIKETKEMESVLDVVSNYI